MTGKTTFELVSEFRFTCNNLLVTRLAVYVCSSLVTLNLLVHPGPLEVAAFTLGNFLAICIRNLLAVFGTMMAICTFCNFLMFCVRKYGRLRLFCLVFLGLQYHISRAVVCDDDTGATEKNYPKYANNDFFVMVSAPFKILNLPAILLKKKTI